ncbi:pachytene checkpoint protein 2 homolog [Anneissia japonica]|uniref:pachytene checkpoint protein 2 homolog n=1 Tax=Anneissia japonica TaxID=1529436 RepID=UPI0014255B5D|nr:pachytene checkpoint protein 2 homolog [Anneissia japonica]
MNGISDLEESLPETPVQNIHIEVCQNPLSTAKPTLIQEHTERLLRHHRVIFGNLKITEFDDEFLVEHVKSITVCDTELETGKQVIDMCHSKLSIHVYKLGMDGPGQEELDDEELSAANHWLLPSVDFDGMWENLIFDDSIKTQLLQYAHTTLLFSDRKVDSNIISWNRVVLLHGPPGTGKTSLCKALAQKLCIRLSDRYTYGQLIEINSHSLFSKWFSESGKLVMKMFQKIQELIDDPNSLVCVLIDEVESLTAARKSALNGTEPSDAIRVVNALLTQIDQIKKYPNVLILTTSNVTGAIDLAFVDRADIKQYIGPPSPAAIFKIYLSCINELMKTGIISPTQSILDMRSLESMRFVETDVTKLSLYLKNLSDKSYGLSGRSLRKMPFLAHALFVQRASVSLEEFLDALSNTISKQLEDRENLNKD